MRTPFLILIGLFLALTVKAQGVNYFPARNADWVTRSPEEVKMEATAVNQALAFALQNEYSGSRDLRIAILKGFEREPFHEILGPTKKRGGPAGMILKNGYLIASWGDIQRVDMTFSVTKSFLSTVAGLAADRKLIESTSDKVDSYIWDGTFSGEHNAKITWEHLLQQTSDWSGELWGGKDWADRPPREGDLDDWKFRKQNEPGTVMEYNDVRVNLLAYSLTHVWGKALPAVLRTELMDPIGASTTWRWFGYENAWTEVDGVELKSVTGGGHSGGGIFINTLDMARFGLLFLNEGKWEGKQFISSAWIQKATTPSIPNPNYGYLWWLNTKGERHWEGWSESLFYAAGFGGNFIIVDREHDLVVVTRWLEPSQIEEFMKILRKAF
ncbi:CubicO group peptidase, beta-lactamase class C family [Muriicola jejuensis]|uniref:Serine hydrolase n=1 Tax=Muriicola jejuensis TaxID=504488 RepID=A0A6P0UF21_9FLAO|nr:serine hydrolase [Muriicola jejuensis]NER09853.1 serine hydrolase [Muriicola jejuensis]SMP05153.1 CubicO group peptidase, beta-lactamase class C family [Muriicola jejuensis]